MRGASPDKSIVAGWQPAHSIGEGGSPGVNTLTFLPIGQTQPEVRQLVMKFVQLSLLGHRAGWEGMESGFEGQIHSQQPTR